MWIEIDLKLHYEPGLYIPHIKRLINSRHIVSIINHEENENYMLSILTSHNPFNIECYTQTCTQAIYNGFLIALQGSPVVFDEWGYIKPLLNDQVESIHRRMLYQETISSLANCEGLK